MSHQATILLADDHPIVRNGMRMLIETQKDYTVISEADNGEIALQKIMETQPSVAILDIDMPLLNGLEVVTKANESKCATRFIVMTMYKDESLFSRAIDLGVRGYILKENAVMDILQCIKAVVEGKHFISPALSEYLFQRSERKDSSAPFLALLEKLTPTEKKVLKLLSEMKTSKEIAEELFVSTKTIENHRNNICTKLEIRGAHALLKFAMEHKDKM
ncbi:MAG: response regulator transcription factor [Bacteroidetes bacterium]|nr:MAG: response regulator transcription factor [Bacteroidota bacterium]